MKFLADYYSRPIDIASAEGCYVFDRNGKRYLDFLAGWCVGNVGWKQHEVVTALRKEAERGLYVPPVFRFREQEEFAERLVGYAPGNRLARAFRCCSGSEAVEFALKCARAATGKPTVVSVSGVYHGHTYGAASVGDACVPAMAPCVPGFEKISLPRPRTGSLAALKEFEALVAGRDDIAAFISEPVFTNAGAIIPPADFYPAVERICTRHGILFIMDEVATGLGRCGKLFASELWKVEPDILCLGKGLTGGYGTMGATLVSETVFKNSRGIPSYSTFGWLPLDLAAARAVLEVILKERLWENAASVGKHLQKLLKPSESLAFVSEVRGIGLLLGIEIVKDKGSRTPDVRKAGEIADKCAELGLLLETAGNTLFITPPLILTPEQAAEGAAILLHAFEG